MGNVVDIVYLDFSKAFDKVSHNIFVRKLAKTGLDKITIKWICNWLADRTQRVLINCSSSSWSEVTAVFHKVLRWGWYYLTFSLMILMRP